MTGTTAQEAADLIIRLFIKYKIDDPRQAKRLVRERFTQEDLDAYRAARDLLDGTGAIG